MTIHQALIYASDKLGDFAEKNALIYPLLAHSLSVSKEHLWANPSKLLTHDQFNQFDALLNRAKLHEPLAHLTGVKEFYGRPFFVTQDTLIPRPETEFLVDKLIIFFSQHDISHPTIVDVGTGSGNLAITLAKEIPSATIYAIDVSPAALEVAKRNAAHLKATNVFFLHGSLLAPLQGLVEPTTVNVIVANLPYISDDEFDQLPITVREFEPELALRSGADPDVLNHKLASQVGDWLAPTSLFAYETTNGKIVTSIADSSSTTID